MLFLYRKDTGQPYFSQILLVLGRGAGKNGWVSTLTLFLISELNGIKKYDISIVATSEKQAMTSLDEINQTIDDNPKLKGSFDNIKQKITGKQTHSHIISQTSNAKTKDGGREGMVVFDEIHAYENAAIVNVFRSGLGKVADPRTLMIGSMGYVRGGFMDKKLDLADKVLNGELPMNTLLPIIAQLDDEKQVNEPENWELANPMLVKPLNSYGKLLFTEIKNQYSEMTQDDSQRAEFLTKRMNLPATDTTKSVATKEEILATNIDVNVPNGATAIGAVDFSSVRDFTAVGLLFKVDGKYVWKTHSFATKKFVETHMGYNLPANEIKGSRVYAPLKEWENRGDLTILNSEIISPSVVVDWFDQRRDTYQIDRIVIDTFRADFLRNEFQKAGFDNFDVIRSPRSITSLLAPRVEAGFANHEFAWGDVPIMRWYTWNVLVKIKPDGNREYLKKEERRRKTDGFMAFLYALYRADELEEAVDLNEALDLIMEVDF